MGPPVCQVWHPRIPHNRPIRRSTRHTTSLRLRVRYGVPEVGVVEIKEVLRLWMAGKGLRTIRALTRVDRKTARRYVEAAVAAGLD